jgi:hypothetical protein
MVIEGILGQGGRNRETPQGNEIYWKPFPGALEFGLRRCEEVAMLTLGHHGFPIGNTVGITEVPDPRIAVPTRQRSSSPTD